jgi:hypothetical protein
MKKLTALEAPLKKSFQKELPKLTSKEKMIAQLKNQNLTAHSAQALVDEIFSKQKFEFVKNHTAQTVGEYYKKHLSKNGKYAKTHKNNLPVQQL